MCPKDVSAHFQTGIRTAQGVGRWGRGRGGGHDARIGLWVGSGACDPNPRPSPSCPLMILSVCFLVGTVLSPLEFTFCLQQQLRGSCHYLTYFADGVQRGTAAWKKSHSREMPMHPAAESHRLCLK